MFDYFNVLRTIAGRRVNMEAHIPKSGDGLNDTSVQSRVQSPYSMIPVQRQYAAIPQVKTTDDLYANRRGTSLKESMFIQDGWLGEDVQ